MKIEITIPDDKSSLIGKSVKFKNKVVGKVTGHSGGKAELEIDLSSIPLKNQNITMSCKYEKEAMT